MPKPEDPSSTRTRSRVWYYVVFALIVVMATAVRLRESASWRKTGFDELIYRRYLTLMDGGTQKIAIFQKDMSIKLWEYDVAGTGANAVPSLTRLYLRTQAIPGTECELPPTRFFYTYTSWLWKNIRFGEAPALDMREIAKEWQTPPTGPDRKNDVDHRDPPLRALHDVALAFGVLTFVIAGLFGTRMFGPWAGLAIMAIFAFDPILIHLSQHAMVDGFFTFWALLVLWTTWENLRSSNHRGWLIAHAVGIAFMVMTKENAFFVYVALTIVVVTNRWLRFGTVTPRFLIASFLGGFVGLCVLVWVAGGVGNFIDTYKTFVSKAQHLEFVQLHGDGPWYRYLIDLLTVNPIVFCLALGGCFSLTHRCKDLAFLVVFLAGSYLLMCSVRYGANLRFATIWTFPFAALAFAMVRRISRPFGRYRWPVVALVVMGLSAYEYRQLLIFTGNPNLAFYEVTPSDLLRHLRVIKN